MSRFWLTRDRYDNPLSYSIWTIEPVRDQDGHWARRDPKRTATDVRQICSAKVAEALIGRPLQLGEKMGPLVGIWPCAEEPAHTTKNTQ